MKYEFETHHRSQKATEADRRPRHGGGAQVPDRKVGRTADYARALGEGVVDKSVVFGARSFF